MSTAPATASARPAHGGTALPPSVRAPGTPPGTGGADGAPIAAPPAGPGEPGAPGQRRRTADGSARSRARRRPARGTDSEENTMDLSLPQRLYLLGHDIDKGRVDPVSAAYRGQLLCAAALAELTIGGWLRARDGMAEPTGTRPDDPFLAAVLADFSPDRPRHFNSAVYLRMAEAEEAARRRLTDTGWITEARGRALGLFPTRTITLAHPEQVRLLREHTRNAVLAGHEAAAPIGDAALVAIAAEGDVWTVLTPQERHEHRPALTALQERFDAAVPGLRTAVRAAVMATGRGAAY